nr:uncharacterized protein LOC107280714 [Oryza sativa Japonica Group]
MRGLDVATSSLVFTSCQLHRLLPITTSDPGKSRERAPAAPFFLISIVGHQEDEGRQRNRAAAVSSSFAFLNLVSMPVPSPLISAPIMQWFYGNADLAIVAPGSRRRSNRTEPPQAEPLRHQGRLDVPFKIPQEPHGSVNRGGRSASSSPTPAAGIDLRFLPLRSSSRSSCRRSPAEGRRRQAVPQVAAAAKTSTTLVRLTIIA